MGLPSGVSTATVTFGTDLDVLGVGATTTLTITPSHTLIWAATGEIIRAFSVSVDAAANVVGSFEIPHTDQVGFTDELGRAITNWYYTVVGLVTRGGEVQPYRKVFQVTSDVATMNLDLVPVDGVVRAVGTAPVPAVTSVVGATGPVDAATIFAAIEPNLQNTIVSVGMAELGGPALMARRAAQSVVFLGDSNTALGSTESARSYGNSFPTLASYMSDGQVVFTSNAGVPSDTVQMIAARVDADVIAKAPSACFILAGTNSTTKGIAHFTAAMASYENDIIVKLIRKGIEPILATIPPRDFNRTVASGINVGPEVYLLTSAWNVFVRAMAVKYRLRLVDIYAATVDPSTANYIDGYSDDTVHFSYEGVAAVARAVAAALTTPYRVAGVPLCLDRYELTNAVSSPLFLGGVGSGTGGQYPSGWNGAASGIVAVTLVDPTVGDGLQAGKWMRLTKTAGSTGNVNMIRTLSTYTASSGVPYATGDRVGFGFRYRLTEALPEDSKYVTVSLNFRGAGGSGDIKKTTTPLSQIRRTLNGTAWIEDTVPADTVDIRVDITFSSSSTAVFDIGQPTIYNLTAMGVPSFTVPGAITTPTMTTPPNPATATPAQPTGLAVGTVTDTTIALSWTAASGATGYEVQTRIGSGAWVAAGSPSGTSHTVTGATASTRYRVRVRATNTAGPGPWTAGEVFATTTSTTPRVLLASDSFNRADTAAGTLGTLDNAAGGTLTKTWATTSQMQIVSNVVAGTPSTLRLSGFDSGLTDGYVQIEVVTGEGGVYIRGADATSAGSDRYAAYYDLASNKVYLVGRYGGSTNFLWTSATGVFTPGSGNTIGIGAVGTAISVYANGTLLQTVTNGSITTGNFVGIRSSAASPWTYSEDNFKLYDKFS